MASRTDTVVTRPRFLVEEHNAARHPGKQIDWSAFGTDYQDAEGDVVLKGGTPVAVDDTSGKLIPRDTGAGDTAVGLLATTASEKKASDHDSLSGYGFIIGGVVYEDLLPNPAGADMSTVKTELQDASDYGFEFVGYSDDRS